MKIVRFFSIARICKLVILIIIISSQIQCKNSSKTTPEEVGKSIDSLDAEQHAIRTTLSNALEWATSQEDLDLLPATFNPKDSLFAGFDTVSLNKNYRILDSTGYFTKYFINNYKVIVDSATKVLGYRNWIEGYLPPINFSSDINPWCMCQDIPPKSDKLWSTLMLKDADIEGNKADVVWTWNLPDFKNSFGYRASLKKVNDQWQIDYLQGFDITDAFGEE